MMRWKASEALWGFRGSDVKESLASDGGRVDRRLRLRPQRVDVRADRDGDRGRADRDHGQGDAVLGQVLAGLVTNQLLEKIHHGSLLLYPVSRWVSCRRSPEG